MLTKLDLSEVDVYSMYSNNDTLEETPGSELEEPEYTSKEAVNEH